MRVRRLLLWPLALIYGSLVRLRNFAYDLGIRPRLALGERTFSVGNIAVGGAGKTPAVIALAGELIAQGERVGILTRGYGTSNSSTAAQVLINGRVAWANQKGLDVADEPNLMSTKIPEAWVVVGAKRYAAYMQAARWRQQSSQDAVWPTVWILDDGFQHRQIARDIDMVLVSGADLGSEGLLPAGNLREPIGSLKRANEVWLAKVSPTEQPQVQAQLEKLGVTVSGVIDYQMSWPRSRSSKELESNYPFAAICGIARPQRFLDGLTEMGLVPMTSYVVQDHAPLDVQTVQKYRSEGLAIVTTEKDWHRDPQVFSEISDQVFIVDYVARLNRFNKMARP